MKNRSFLLLLTLFFIMMSYACQQEDLITDSDIPASLETEVEKIDDFFLYTHNPVNLVKNESDVEDAYINEYILYPIANGLRIPLKDPAVRKTILDQAKLQNGIVLIADVINQFESVERNIYDHIISPSIDALSATMSKSGILYYPVIYVPNWESASAEDSYLISPGLEINDDDANGIYDEIFAWYYNSTGLEYEVRIGESQNNGASEPLFVVCPHMQHYFTERTDESAINETGISANTVLPVLKTIRTEQYKINHRYERTGKSELYLAGAKIFPNGNIVGLPGVQESWDDLLIDQIHKDDIGNTIFKTVDLVVADINLLFDTDRFLFNTFEYDWYASPKSLGKGVAYGAEHFIEGKRKFFDEWYAFDPTGTTVSNEESKQFHPYTLTYEFSFPFPTEEELHTMYDHSKGKMISQF